MQRHPLGLPLDPDTPLASDNPVPPGGIQAAKEAPRGEIPVGQENGMTVRGQETGHPGTQRLFVIPHRFFRSLLATVVQATGMARPWARTLRLRIWN